MKYINKFSTNADYQAFTEGGGYVTPNVCYVEETDGIIMKPEISENNTLQFPIYLTIGDNGQLGKDVHSYILSKFHEVGLTSYDMTETIYVNGIIVYSADSNAPLEFVHNADINLNVQTRPYYILRPTGELIDTF